jgi:hypothetical protein
VSKHREEKQRTYARRWKRKHSDSIADIGDIPPIANPQRREACRLDLFRFLITYFPQTTGLRPFSEDHRRVIDRIQSCCLNGGQFLNVVYRGFAKTTIAENASVWATIYGHRKFVPVFGSAADSAESMISSIKMELAENDLLYDDFPEVCHAIRALEGKPQRCASQTYLGERTHIEWRADTIVLPAIPGSAAGGSILTSRGITAGSRGLKHKRPDGTQQRPDFVIIDDPQTDESASTALQVYKRSSLINKNILRLGGHDRRIACVMNATVIHKDDLVDQFLNPARYPAWQGERIKMVKRFADSHESLWLGEYAKIRNTYDRESVGDQARAHADATKFYRLNRDAMDKGCIVSWPECYDRDTEISAIQHAYNILIDSGPEVFASECQNEPLEAKAENAVEVVSARDICQLINNRDRGEIPTSVSRVVAFIDVQKNSLWWMVAGFEDGFTGYVIDYGVYPDQNRPYFTLRDLRRTLQSVTKAPSLEAALHAGLTNLANDLCSREWMRDDGAAMRIERGLIDANWDESSDVIYQWARESAYAAVMMPSHGRFYGAKRPWGMAKQNKGDRRGLHWCIPAVQGRKSVRYVYFDSNYWKSFIQKRLQTPSGGRGRLTLFGNNPEAHRMLADHLTAETPHEVSTQGRTAVEWQLKANKPDQHWLDCMVGCHVAASMQGAALSEHTAKPVVRQRIKLSDLQKQKRAQQYGR